MDYERATKIALRGPEIVARSEQGEPEASAAMDRYEDRLARCLAQVTNLLDPDVIVFGGGLSQIGRLYRNVPPKIREHVFGKEADTPIYPAKHGDASGVRGAAWLWPLSEH
jgi:fructokinase